MSDAFTQAYVKRYHLTTERIQQVTNLLSCYLC